MHMNEMAALLVFLSLLILVANLVQLKTTAGLLKAFKAQETGRMHRLLALHAALLVLCLGALTAASLSYGMGPGTVSPALLGGAFACGGAFVLLGAVLHVTMLFAIERHVARLRDAGARLAEDRERLSVELDERRQLEGDLWAIVGELRQRVEADEEPGDMEMGFMDFTPPSRKN